MRRAAAKDPEAEQLYRALGESVQKARSREGWSQGELARRADLTRSSVANIELGRQHAPLHTLWAIARALGLELRSLIPTSPDLELRSAGAETDTSSDARKSDQIIRRSGPRLQAFVSSVRREPSHADSSSITSSDRATRDAGAAAKPAAGRADRRRKGREGPEHKS